MTNVPEIRFKGFTDAWEQRKFEDDVANIQTGTNLLGSEANTGMPLLKMGNIQRGYFSLNKLERLNPNDIVVEQDIVQYGDFLFNTRNTLALVGKGATWFDEGGKFAFNSNIARFTFNDIDTVFFNYLYNTKGVISQVGARAVGTTSVAAVYPRDLYSLEYFVPSKTEQSRIGQFFRTLDDTIAIYKRKLDGLRKLKKAYLQVMFPQAGETVPKVRFEGFDGVWEERELGELYDIYSGQTPFRGDTENFLNPTTAWMKTTDLNNAAIDVNEEDISDKALEKLRLLPIGSVLVAMYGGFNQIGRTGMLTYPATINQAISALPPISDVDPYFLLTELNYRVEEWKKVAASSRKDPNITKKDVESFVLKYPDNKEQTAIGKIFATLDRLIATQTQKLDQLKRLKTAYLQKMFV